MVGKLRRLWEVYRLKKGISCRRTVSANAVIALGIILGISSVPLASAKYIYQPYGVSEDSYEYGYTQHDAYLDSKNKNRIETEQQCKNYLCKYGYLNCNCSSYLLPIPNSGRRKKRAVESDVIPSEYEITQVKSFDHHAAFPPILTTPSNQACKSFHFQRGYEQFQASYKLNITGRCDIFTKSYMSRSRCGQPDIFNTEALNEPDSSEINKYYKGYDTFESDETSDEKGYKVTKIRLKRDLTEYIASDHHSRIRRSEQLQELIAQQENNHETYNHGQSSRVKRSFGILTDPIGKLNKEVITWRLMSAYTNPSMALSDQISILSQAFRYWSEVTPLCFREDKWSQRVDVEVGFLEGIHLNCYKQFDGLGGEIAHKFYRDVHFDKKDPYSTSPNPTQPSEISLLLVAVHEIGHVLGLNHSSSSDSVMNAIYHRNIRGRFELSSDDRQKIKELYGPCGGRFDIVMDYVRNSGSSRVFNTYFFRGNNFWIYENKHSRTRYGDPKKISSKTWHGLPSHLDAFVHYFESDHQSRNRVSEHYYFFKGVYYYKFDPDLATVVQKGTIRSMFRPGHFGMIPDNLDSAFFEYNTKVIYFFKGSMVYKYDYKLSGSHSCCIEKPRQITSVFPPMNGRNDLHAPSGETYADGVDSVYLSWSAPYQLHLIKGEEAWRVDGYSIFGQYNEANLRVRYVGKWNTIWHYLCEADCPT